MRRAWQEPARQVDTVSGVRSRNPFDLDRVDISFATILLVAIRGRELHLGQGGEGNEPFSRREVL
jgi:hypothetical protein